MWHPWRSLKVEHPHWSVEFALLPIGILGYTSFASRTVWLHRDMLQAQRRCTLTHELVHIECGHAGEQDRWTEAQVEQQAARRLIPLDKLLDAIRWARSSDELAEELWVDQATLRARLEHLHPAERAAVNAVIRERQEHDSGR